jgi:dTDP-L-rhamnose 4-epimerase
MKEVVLITGGAGFIGSFTADLLILRGYKVIIYDILNPKTHNGKWPEYINPKAVLIKGDVTDKISLTKAISGVDYIIHLAAEMDLNPDFQKFMDVNVGSTALIYEIIIKNNFSIKKVIVASSQFVYGEGKWECKDCGIFDAEIRSKNKMKNKEWDQTCPKCNKISKYCLNKEDHQNPPNHYALSKFFQEKLSLQLGKLYSIPTVAMRYSIVHGPRQSLKNTYSGALRTFAISIKLNRPISTFEDNESLRDFISVKDVAEANLKVLESNSANYEIFNVGSGEALSVNKLAETLAKKMKMNFSFSSTSEFRVGDIRNAVSDISKLKKIGWNPKYSEEQTLENYVEWFLKQDIDYEKFLKTQIDLRDKEIVIKSNNL